MHRNFARLGFENEALNADNIADIPFFECCVFFLAHIVAADIKLNFTAAVCKTHKACLAHYSAGHYSAGNFYGFALKLIKIVLYCFRI